MGKLTTRLLRRAAAHAARGQAIQAELTQAFMERYGATYSDVDADDLIDTLDYLGGAIDLPECDRAMSIAGHPPMKKGGSNA